MATRTPRSKSKAEAASAVDPAQAPVALIWGGDEYRVRTKARELVHAWCPAGQQDLGVETIDGLVETIDEAVSAIQRTLEAVSTVGLFGGAKVVWLKDATFFSEAPPGKYEAVKEAVARLTEEIKTGLLPGMRLLISADKVHRGYAFYKACQANGLVMEFDVPERPRELADMAQATVGQLLKQEGLVAPGAAVQLLIDKAGYDTRQLHQEVQKLATYLGERREVTVDDVRLMVAPSRESATWDLAEALGQRDLAGCLRLFRQLLFQKESPVALMMGLEGRIRDMLALRELMDRGYLRLSGSGGYVNVAWSDLPEAREAAAAMVGGLLKGHPYRVMVLARSAAAFSLAELRRWYQVAVQTHARMMMGGVSDDLMMESMMIDLIRGGQRAGG